MKYLQIINNILLIIITLLFSWSTIQIYWINNDWNHEILNMGSTKSKRIMFDIILSCGIFSTLIFSLQKICVECGLHKNSIIKYTFHIPIGILLFLSSIVMAICEILYVILWRTVGGIIMDIFFVSYVTLLLLSSIICVTAAINLYKIHNETYRRKVIIINFTNDDENTINSINDEEHNMIISQYVKNWDNYHYCVNNIFGALIYSPVFYKILYIYSALFGYGIPNRKFPEYYKRPLDYTFDLLFYMIPLFGIMLYNFIKIRKMIVISNIMKIITMIFLISTIIIYLLR